METIKEYVNSQAEEGKYYWIYAVYQGRLLVDGWYRTATEAYSFGYQKLPCRFDTIALSTRDRAKATQAIKHQVLGQTKDLDLALKRAKHKL